MVLKDVSDRPNAPIEEQHRELTYQVNLELNFEKQAQLLANALRDERERAVESAAKIADWANHGPQLGNRIRALLTPAMLAAREEIVREAGLREAKEWRDNWHRADWRDQRTIELQSELAALRSVTRNDAPHSIGYTDGTTARNDARLDDPATWEGIGDAVQTEAEASVRLDKGEIGTVCCDPAARNDAPPAIATMCEQGWHNHCGLPKYCGCSCHEPPAKEK